MKEVLTFPTHLREFQYPTLKQRLLLLHQIGQTAQLLLLSLIQSPNQLLPGERR